MSAPTVDAPRIGSWLDRVVDRRVDLRALALMRVLMGAIVVRHLWPDIEAPVTPVERFHVPWWSWLPVPPAGLYRGLAWLGIVAGVAMVLGLVVRLATVTALLVVSYLLFVDMTMFAHNRGFLVWLLFGLSLLPTGGAFSVAHLRRDRPDSDTLGPWWPVLMLRIVVASVYLTSGGTKLLNPDWRSGRVLWDRMNRTAHLVPFDGALHDFFLSRAFHYVLSPTAIAVELFLAVGLWFGRTRLAAVWVAVIFHVSIELMASVQTFSYSALAATLIWVTPSTRDRELAATGTLRGVVCRLDWLHRFRLVDPAPHMPVVLVDRDGTRRTGRDAALTALSRLPALFPVIAPVLAAARRRQRRAEVRA